MKDADADARMISVPGFVFVCNAAEWKITSPVQYVFLQEGVYCVSLLRRWDFTHRAPSEAL